MINNEEWNKYGINKETGTRYNKNGYDKEGYDKYGYDVDGCDKDGYDKEGYNWKGFNRSGINKETGTEYDEEGYDKEGYDSNGFDQYGNHKKTRTNYDEEGYDKKGYDKYGYSEYGYDEEGYDKEGYNWRGFNKDRIHRITGTEYDEQGYDYFGYDQDGYNEYGYDEYGYDRNGLNWVGLRKEEKNKMLEDLEHWMEFKESRNNYSYMSDFKKLGYGIASKEKCILEYIDNNKQDEDFLIKALKTDRNLFYYLPDDIKNNSNILMEYIKMQGIKIIGADKVLTKEQLDELEPYITFKVEGRTYEVYGDYRDYRFTITNTIYCSRGDEKFEIKLTRRGIINPNDYDDLIYFESYSDNVVFELCEDFDMEMYKVKEFKGIEFYPTEEMKDKRFIIEQDYVNSSENRIPVGLSCSVFEFRASSGGKIYEIMPGIFNEGYEEDLEESTYTPEEIAEGIEVKESDVTEVMKEIIKSEKQEKDKDKNRGE